MNPPGPIFDPTFLNLEYLFYKILQLFRAIYEFFATFDYAKLLSLINILFTLSAILFITVIIYTTMRIRELRAKELEELKKFIVREPTAEGKNDKWDKIQKDIESINENDWRLAIIEADSILDEMVKQMGLKGEDLGERLKSVEPSDFDTLDDAWEAHKVRNRIAHDGSAYPLTQSEAKRIIGLYEKVFREFKYI
jgi:hypothetical protein